jgi:hypothetical protein
LTSSNQNRTRLPRVNWHAIGPKELLAQVSDNGGLILRDFGADQNLLDSAFGEVGFSRFVDDLNRSSIPLSVGPGQLSHAERTLAGEFHTDFSQHKIPPRFTVIACLQVDPRHPYYGRNQIVRVEEVLKNVALLDVNLYQRFVTCEFPVVIRGKKLSSRLLDRSEAGRLIVRYHPGYLDETRLQNHHFYRGMRLDQWIHHVAMSLCDDFVLNAGDCVIIDNHLSLHRRDTATVVLGSGLSLQESRRILSWRYSA